MWTSATLTLPDENATAALAAQLATILRAGDTCLLEGDIGAGKSFLVRALIRARLGYEAEVPSPTFTLVQTYDANDVDIWHCDLYRLTHPDEAIELGLDEAFTSAICLIEWPDRLADMAPDGALWIKLQAGPQAHLVQFSGPESWRDRLQAAGIIA